MIKPQQKAREGLRLSARELESTKTESPRTTRDLAEEAFARAAGARLVKCNNVRLLKNADENYPAWLDAIHKAEKYIFF